MGTDSPVSADSSTFRPLVLVRRRSAGIWHPASRQTTSPGTSCDAAISFSFPSRMQYARGLVSFFRESSALCAFPS